MNITLLKGFHKKLPSNRFEGRLSIVDKEFTFIVNGHNFAMKDVVLEDVKSDLKVDRFCYLIKGSLGSKHGSDFSPAELRMDCVWTKDLRDILCYLAYDSTMDMKAKRRIVQPNINIAYDKANEDGKLDRFAK